MPMIAHSWKGRLARDLLDLYERAVGFRTPRAEGVRARFSAFHLRHYQQDLMAFLRAHLTPASVFIDVGANIGYVSRAAARIVGPGGKVLAFEPNPSVFPLLEKNCRSIPGIAIHNLAVGEQAGVLSLGFRENQTGEASLLAPGREAGDVQVPVQVVPLASYLAGLDPAARVVLKIDVEGFELPVLKGLGEGRLPDGIVAEYNPRWQRIGGFAPRAFYEWFSSRGYRIHILGAGATLTPASFAEFQQRIDATSELDSFDVVGLRPA